MKVTGTEDAVATGGDVAVFRDGDPDQDSPDQEVVDEAAEPSTVPRFSPRTVHPQRRWTKHLDAGPGQRRRHHGPSGGC
ncbi:hypothetical protein ACFPKZ_35210 [Streptosporangium amethystogenes subsp. fukuiense]|uniref:hypothetical protein n=1 Tax=Streptosporangium amethystogenes TaxID=2002 RepID=UPI00360CB62A